MQQLRVGYLVERNAERWHAVRQWDTLLSMGEGQCLGIIRALYSEPKRATGSTQIRGSGGSLEPLGLFPHTSIPRTWRIRSAFLPAWAPWLRGPVSPRWAVLDEPTSAMSEEVAKIAFAMLQARGISYVSVSQAASAIGRSAV